MSAQAMLAGSFAYHSSMLISVNIMLVLADQSYDIYTYTALSIILLASVLCPQAIPSSSQYIHYLLTLNHAAYIAGKLSKVSTVATARPPIIATAIGPQNTLRVSGIIARMAAAAVNTMGR
jgi:hypothetical protein